MTYENISYMALINEVNEEKVNMIAENMKENGFVGCPILIWNDQLLTGSHRLAALRKLDDDGYDVLDWDVAEDVTDIVEAAFENFEEENGWMREADLSDIGWMLKGSWIEKYKEEIKEW